MAKHEEHEEHENHERWLVSYADFITLLFAFFVVMYAISSVDQKRAIKVESAVKWALHIQGHGGGGDRILTPDGSLPGARALDVVPMQPYQRDKNAFESVKSRIVRKVAAVGAGEARPSVLVMLEGKNLIVRVSALHLFENNEAVIRPSALPTLDAVLAEVGQMKKTIRVEGHTDNAGATPLFDKNWALSAERAAAVVAYAQASRLVDASRLSLAGWGAKHPVASNDTEDGREKNRRIDIIVDLSDEVGNGPP